MSYRHQEALASTGSFWTVFGQYMAPILSAEGQKIQWINYATGVKGLFFRMQATGSEAFISIEVAHRDIAKQSFYFNQLEQQKAFLHNILEEEWNWIPQQTNGSSLNPTIKKTLSSVSVYRKDDWPSLISFFKPRIIALDQFWCLARDASQSGDLI